MSQRKLSLVVTCTDRKLAAPTDNLKARTLPAGSVEMRAAEWATRLGETQPQTRLVDLYGGESWVQSKQLAKVALEAGWEPEIFVASAGLGLRKAEELAPAYAATFTRGQPDSVSTSAVDAQTWWNLLPHTSRPSAENPSIWVLSEVYATAMGSELKRIDPDTSLVFGGASATPDSVRIRADRTLRSALGGTVTSLNTRMAIRWLELAGRDSITAPSVRSAWRAWVETSRHVETYNRRRISDAAICALILELDSQIPSLSKTVALRTLRASGLACEQRRFSDLFESTLGA